MLLKRYKFLVVMVFFVLIFTLQAYGMSLITTGQTVSHSINDFGYPCAWMSRTSTPFVIAQIRYGFEYRIIYDTVDVNVDDTSVISGTKCKVKADIQLCNDNNETLLKTLNYTTNGSTSLNGKWGVTTTWTNTTFTNDWAGSSCYFSGN